MIVDLPAELSIKLGESIEIPAFTASPLSQINWSPPEGLECTDCLVPIAKPTESTRYFLNIEDENGCQWEGSIFIKVAIPDIYIPNVFSPNNDGSNDTFAPALNNAVESITSFSIYDRWGAQVFQSSSSLPSWDGFIGGQLAGQGVYVYFLEWVDKAGNRRLETGEVLLLY
ncbi:MAG: gliding motility-associated C-terminal domain-containing protein [Bacteroidota bacterium]